MKINHIKISNILSFEYKEDIEDADQIDLDSGLNILIGPNGAGKSNFLEIFNKIFKNILFQPCILQQNILNNYYHHKYIQNKNQILWYNNNYNLNLENNFYSSNEEQKIKLSISINRIDLENMKKILNNKEDIEKYLKEFSNLNFNIFNYSSELIEKLNNLSLESFYIEIFFYRSNLKNFFGENSIVSSFEDNELEKFILNYFKYFNFLQNAIYLINFMELKNIDNLKNTFSLIGSYRNYNSINNYWIINQNHNLNEMFVKDNTRNILNNNEPIEFLYIKSFLGRKFQEKKDEGVKDSVIKKNLYKKEFIKKINELLKKFLDLNFIIKKQKTIDVESPHVEFAFSNLTKGTEEDLSYLSAGEKGIIHLIFSLFAFNLENGLIVVDEPEIHLHPSWQKKYLEVLEEVSTKFQMQIIIATHSPSFINPNVIKSVHRFYKDEEYTKISFPNEKIDDNYRNLLKFIHYTNSEKIFFADKIILVEGESDEYFFRAFLEKFKKDQNINKIYDKISILKMGGKGNSKKWKKFLDNFGINNYFIFDFDKIKDFHSLGTEEYKKLNLKGENGETKGELIKGIAQESYDKLLNDIQNKYSENIYILKKGELEDYLGLQKGETEKIINFCNKKQKFNELYYSDSEYVNELKEIFKKILKI